jgi:kinesin family protein 2/24
MGAEQSSAAGAGGGGGPPKNEDKRTSRLENKESFVGAIDAYRASQPTALGIGPAAPSDAAEGIHVCIRKRPLFQHEVDAGDYDATTVAGGTRLVVHDGRMKPDMRSMFMRHQSFSFDRVFGEQSTNVDVYGGTAAPLVRHAVGGGIATVFMFGQTGSGKTYTMSAIHRQAAEELFEMLDAELDAGGEESEVVVTYVELAGSVCRDMLNDGATVPLMADANGEVHMCGAAEQSATDAQELLDVIRDASARRATCATGVHDQSSRTHAVCRITIRQGGSCHGMFTMVDLAGTERGKDSKWHDEKLQKETAEINSSLMALKDCVRERASGAKYISFRASKLTQLLRSCFVSSRACTVVIATVSPSSGDTEHTLCTLQHSSLMDGQASSTSSGAAHVETVDVKSSAEVRAEQQRASAPKEPKRWSTDEAADWWHRAATLALRRAGASHACGSLALTQCRV